jgi:1-aminocyclopropane-1-carboxylate deaminase/D-cysteine desulfhydrase-like pyridoxal-dependent ACC family enzyme
MSKLKDWGSIFPKLSIDPEVSQWENHLMDLTPVQKVGQMYFKREDMFAPLGYGGINGSKLRQAIWLVDRQNKIGGDQTTLISGASIKSPQLPMSSAVAYHFGYSSLHVIGATRPDTCMSKDMVKMATWFGAKFAFLKVGYNPVLQNKVNSLIEGNKGKYFKLNYGITIGAEQPEESIVEFHYIGANQVQNIPEEVETIIIPAGSGNSCISVLYGLAHFKPKNLKNIYLIGVGPSKLKFINARLKLIKEVSKVNTLNLNHEFGEEFETDPDLRAYSIKYIDIHSIPKYDYQNEVKFEYEGIEFHPTYEGKILDYLITDMPELINPKTMLWIVGGKPRIECMQGCEELGEIKSSVKVFSNDWEKK